LTSITVLFSGHIQPIPRTGTFEFAFPATLGNNQPTKNASFLSVLSELGMVRKDLVADVVIREM